MSMDSKLRWAVWFLSHLACLVVSTRISIRPLENMAENSSISLNIEHKVDITKRR